MKFRFFIVFTLSFVVLKSQQWVQFTQLNQYDTYRNVAFTGFDSQLSAVAAHRSQYVGLGAEAIYTQLASFSMPIATPKFGLGFRFLNDKIGLQRYSQLELSAAYHPLTNKHKLSFGASVGFVQLGLNGNEITAPDGSYLPGTIVHNDNYLPNTNSNGLAPTLSLGALYNVSNFTLGVGVQNLISPQIRISDTQNGTIIFINRTINASTSYVINTKDVKLTPLVYVKTDFLKWQAQVQLNLEWRKILFGGGFRGYSGLNNDAVFGMLGVKIKNKVSVAYSYDYNLSYLNNSNTGSHEISVRFDLKQNFKNKLKEKILYNPRFL